MISDRGDAVFHFFHGRESPLSNWNMDRPFVLKKVAFNCGEQAMMYCKARLFGDEKMAKLILASDDPAEQKRYGRQVSGFDETVWAKRAMQCVYHASLASVQQNGEALEFLIATGQRVIAEASRTDLIWGIGLAITDDRIFERENWRGLNQLGRVWTDVRNYFTD